MDNRNEKGKPGYIQRQLLGVPPTLTCSHTPCPTYALDIVNVLWGQFTDYLERFPHSNPSCNSYHVVTSHIIVSNRGAGGVNGFPLSLGFHGIPCTDLLGEGDAASPRKTEGWGG